MQTIKVSEVQLQTPEINLHVDNKDTIKIRNKICYVCWHTVYNTIDSVAVCCCNLLQCRVGSWRCNVNNSTKRQVTDMSETSCSCGVASKIWRFQFEGLKSKEATRPLQVCNLPVGMLLRSCINVNVTDKSEKYFIGHFGNDFYKPDDPTKSAKALKKASWPLR